MSLSLEFNVCHPYAGSTVGIEIPIVIRVGAIVVELMAKLDTGSAHCIFQRKYAEMLGLDIESGSLQQFRTVTGTFEAYEHEVSIDTLGIEFSASVFFARDASFSRNFIGRAGWLDRLRVGIVDYDRMLLLSPYET